VTENPAVSLEPHQLSVGFGRSGRLVASKIPSRSATYHDSQPQSFTLMLGW